MKTTSDNSKKYLRLAILAGVLTLIGCFIVFWHPGLATGTSGTPQSPKIPIVHANPFPHPSDSAVATAKARVHDKHGPAGPDAAAVKTLTLKIEDFANRFSSLRKMYGPNAGDSDAFREAARQGLDDLRKTLRDARPDVASAAITDYLDSHQDAATGLEFSVGPGGLLLEAPSIRTALLDELAQVDPAKSVVYAEKVLAESPVADEWALAMRNLGWQNRDGSRTEELRQRFGEMLDNQQWLRNPTSGFLEAFDVAVHLGGPAEFQNMASVLRLEDAGGQAAANGVSRAAYIALDRMSIQNSAQSVQQLDADPDLLSWAPENRAALMARADMSDPMQRAALERYLQRTDLTADETKTFACIFPNRNGSMGNSLISTPGDQLGFQGNLDNDRAALAAVTQWLQDPQFQTRLADLQAISKRLQGFVNVGGSSTVNFVPAMNLPTGAGAPPSSQGTK